MKWNDPNPLRHCPTCGKPFGTSSEVYEHMKMHEGISGKPNIGVCVPCNVGNHADCMGPVSSTGCKCAAQGHGVNDE